MKIKVDKNKPVVRQKGRPYTYPFETLEPGDSFFAPYVTYSLWNNINIFVRKSKKKMKFVTKKTVEKGVIGTRVWRVK